MASNQYINCPKQVRNSCSTNTSHGYSKAQMCLFKILHTISSIPPCEDSKEEALLSRRDGQLGSFRSGGGIGIDLNLRFCSVGENGEFESSADNESYSFAIEANSDRDEAEAEAETVPEKSVEDSEISSNTQVQSFKVDGNGVDHEETKFEGNDKDEDEQKQEEESRKESEGCDGGGEETVRFAGKGREGNNCLDLLIEAAKVISAGSSEKDDSKFEEPSGSELRTRRTSEGSGIVELKETTKKRNQRWVVVGLYSELEDTSPVVRSKRGRSQALPYRFRDSVVEPLKRTGRPQRPSTTATRKRLLGQ